MVSLNEKETELFYKLSKSDDGDVLTGYVQKIIAELSDVESLTSDIIENRRIVKSTLKNTLIEQLQDREVEPEEAESYE